MQWARQMRGGAAFLSQRQMTGHTEREREERTSSQQQNFRRVLRRRTVLDAALTIRLSDHPLQMAEADAAGACLNDHWARGPAGHTHPQNAHRSTICG
jgi:hypothetical protein